MKAAARKPAKSETGAIRYVDRRQIFAEHAFFRGVAAGAIEDLAARSRVEHVRRGRTIFRKGSSGLALMAVLRGTVKICTVSRNGREAVLNLIGPGNVFGEIAVLDGGPRTADAVAGSDCEILVLDRRDLIPILAANPDIAQRLIEVLCGRLRRTSEQLEDVFFLDLPGRLAKMLLRPRDGAAPEAGAREAGAKDGAAKEGGAKDNGRESGMPLTQRELGEMIGTSRESINKQLHKWQRAGIVRIGRGGIDVRRPEALRRLAREIDDATD